MKNVNIEVRKYQYGDDIKKIAKYIYLTDPYIYPDISDKRDSDEWISFIEKEVCSKNSIFNGNNILLAIVNDEIFGIACILKGGNLYCIDIDNRIWNNIAGKNVYNKYFLPLFKDITDIKGTYISNLCVDEELRNKGVRSALLNKIYEHCNKPVTLDCLVNNNSAVRVYSNFGFVIEDKYQGYSSEDSDKVLCYRMVKYSDGK